MNRGKGIRTICIMLVLVAMLVGYYMHLMKRNAEAISTENAENRAASEMTQVQRLIAQSAYYEYPATAVQVVKRYNEIMVCFYNEEWTEAELNVLATMLRGLFDAELVAQQTDEEYLSALKSDVIPFRNAGITIYRTSVTPSTDVEYFTHEGYECASLSSTYQLKQLINGSVAYEDRHQTFILRKDAEGHWRIFGFKEDPVERGN